MLFICPLTCSFLTNLFPTLVFIYNIIYISSGHPCALFSLLDLICCCHDNGTAGIADYFVTQAHAGGDVGGIHGNSFLGPLILKAVYFYILNTVTTLGHNF